MVDTRNWPWEKKALHFFHIVLDPYQINDLHALDSYLKIIINDPRRHGKTTIVCKIFITMKMCEMLLWKRDIGIVYVTNGKENMVDFSLIVANELMFNEKIIENFGMILDDGSRQEHGRLQKLQKLMNQFKGRRNVVRQNQTVLDVVGRKQLFNHTLQVVTIKGSIRGKGFDYTFIDDPVDVFHTVNVNTQRTLTKKIYIFIQTKIIPLTERTIALIGTVYDIPGHDIFSIMEQEGGGRIYRRIIRKAITVFGTYKVRELVGNQRLTPADILIDKPEEWQLLATVIWDLRVKKYAEMGIICTPLQVVLYFKETMKHRFFMQEFQNESIAVSGILDYDKIQEYKINPSGEIKWCVSVDEGMGETSAADYTSIVCIGKQYQNYYIRDIVWGRWTPKEKQKRLEAFVDKQAEELTPDNDFRHIPVLIEAVLGIRGLYMRIRDESWITPKAITPSKREAKKDRIKYGFGGELDNGKTFIYHLCRNRYQLKTEMEGFPDSDDDHIVDSTDQAIYYLKKHAREMPLSGDTF